MYVELFQCKIFILVRKVILFIDLDFELAIEDLMQRGSLSHNIKVLYFVIGGDLINMDTFAEYNNVRNTFR